MQVLAARCNRLFASDRRRTAVKTEHVLHESKGRFRTIASTSLESPVTERCEAFNFESLEDQSKWA